MMGRRKIFHRPHRYLHGVRLEKLLEFLLSGRIGEVSNVQTAALISTGSRSISGLSSSGGAVGGGSLVDSGRGQLFGDVVGRHVDRVDTNGDWGDKVEVCQTNKRGVCLLFAG